VHKGGDITRKQRESTTRNPKRDITKRIGGRYYKKKNLEENYENKKRRTKTYFLPTVSLPSCIIHCFFFV
jgi:hypothetical protein